MSGVDVSKTPPADWDDYVRVHADARIYHEARWAQLPTRLFGYNAWYLSARDAGGRLTGILPLVHQRGSLGSFLVSLPYFNYCGTLAEDAATRERLMTAAFNLGDELGVKYVQLREEQSVQLPSIQQNTDKVAMRMPLPGSSEELSRSLGSKLRSQVRRSERESPVTRIGGAELLDDFFAVFCQVMRDLGTPVYPRRFFDAVLDAAGDRATLVVLDLAGVPSAAGFLLTYRKSIEIPWAGTIAAAKPKSLNMKLYWDVLAHAIERGCSEFDFGRSTIESGTQRFKEQWGARPIQLYWHVHSAHGAGGKSGRAVEMATRLWRRMPLRAANLLGPVISPGLPW